MKFEIPATITLNHRIAFEGKGSTGHTFVTEVDMSGITEADVMGFIKAALTVDMTNRILRPTGLEGARKLTEKPIAWNAKKETVGKLAPEDVYKQAIALGIPEGTARKLANME